MFRKRDIKYYKSIHSQNRIRGHIRKNLGKIWMQLYKDTNRRELIVRGNLVSQIDRSNKNYEQVHRGFGIIMLGPKEERYL